MVGYKQTDIGLIPEDWEVRTIGEFFDFKNGLNKDRINAKRKLPNLVLKILKILIKNNPFLLKGKITGISAPSILL